MSFTVRDQEYIDEQRRSLADPTRSGFVASLVDLHRQVSPEAKRTGKGLPEFLENLLELWRAAQGRGSSGNA